MTLEDEFAAAQILAKELLDVELDKIWKAQLACIKISENYGVPFTCEYGASNTYIPKSIIEKFNIVEDPETGEPPEQVVRDLLESFDINTSEYGSLEGWQQSYC